MLKQRVITALILLPLILGPIIWFPTPWLYVFLAGPGLIAAWEWTALMGMSESTARYAYLALVSALIAAAWYAGTLGHALWVVAVGAIWWLHALRLVAGYPANFRQRPPGRLAMSAYGLLMLVPALLGLAMLHGADHGGRRIFFLFELVWMADIGAYFAGRRFGKRKLAIEVSPGKSIEGAVGGFVASMLVAALSASWVFGAGRFDWLPMLLLCALVIAVSIVGDLTESLFKRHRGVKDSGTLLPGHGGVLDRVDSVLAAAPVLALGLALSGI
ncbi:MAG: phosphatidate cytidylyltransferase [Xanthomonadaceae bacterium]|nr:phosphatidate cytidylyltransferase [Xanthomonadaceae bacterium]